MSNRARFRAKRKAEKKRLFIKKLKKYAHNLFTVSFFLGIVIFIYILLYCFIFEPLVILKSYDSVGLIQIIYLTISVFIIGFSFLMRRYNNFNEEQAWQRNMRLLWDLNFNIELYNSYKMMGIKRIQKKKRKSRHSSSELKEKSN